ncbi:MAG TPA: hypothetical protein VGQ11_00795 [Candidatus Acidoferrales bacterium]|nr:hypothetical protein [Candidatus Acidoferrales bacterium]
MKKETLKKTVWSFFLVLGTVSLLANSPFAKQRKRGWGHSDSSTTVRNEVRDCEDYDITIGSQQPLRGEEERTVPFSIGTLHVEAAENGGIGVSGWERNEYSITACKAAIASGGRSAAENLRQIHLNITGGRVNISGPDGSGWVAHLIIRAPAGADIDMTSRNGPLDVRRVSGKIHARSENGPLAVKDVSGEIRGETQNGPIDFRGSRGNLRLRAENGPISVELTGNRWEGGELDASTQNGPVSLSLPANYQSAVRVDASEHSPISCRASQCRQSARTWEHPSRIEFGGATPVVKLSTVNGPVSIEPN